MPGKALGAGLFEASLAGLADGFPSSFVFVVGGQVADPGVEPDAVVVGSDDGEKVYCCVILDTYSRRVVG